MNTTPNPEETEREAAEVAALVEVIRDDYDRFSGPGEAWSVEGLAISIVDAGFRRPSESEKKGVEYWRELDYVPKIDRLNLPQHLREEIAARRLSESGGVDLDAIRARADALSDFDGEEWQVWYSSATKEPVSVGPDNFTEQFRVDGMAEEDAVFVANAPQDVRELIAEVERLRLSESGSTANAAPVKAGPFLDHEYQPGKFSDACQVMLARYRCPYPAEAHPIASPSKPEILGPNEPETYWHGAGCEEDDRG